jgi:hypothetical protein
MLKKLLGVALLGIMSLQAENRVFELRTYVSKEGKLENVLARFRDHTTKLFEKHGMENIAYWVAADAPASQNTLIYVVAHKSREAAKASWDAFRQDPEWVKARTASEANGAIVDNVKSVFMNPTDFSKMK